MMIEKNSKLKWLLDMLKGRQVFYRNVLDKGLVPGDLDSYEKERILGRLDELNYIMVLLSEQVDIENNEHDRLREDDILSMRIIRCWLDKKLSEIAKRFPNEIEENASSFQCGHTMGYKECLLDLDKFMDETNDE
jgi:hypothetical protein